MKIANVLLPKINEREEDCEDRLQIVTDQATGSLRIAVADGATESAFSGQWAELLVQAYCDQPFSNWDNLSLRAQALVKEWHDAVYLADRPWHALLRARNGAAAALAGLEILPRVGKWSAVALGDSCIFRIRNEQIDFSIPHYRADDFGNHPPLITTDPEKNAGLGPSLKCANGTFQEGDLFLVATDAASEAFLRSAEDTHGIARWVEQLQKGRGAASSFIDSLRDQKRIRDDDVAIVLVVL